MVLIRMEKPNLTPEPRKLRVYKGSHGTQGRRQNLIFQRRWWGPREGKQSASGHTADQGRGRPHCWPPSS